MKLRGRQQLGIHFREKNKAEILVWAPEKANLCVHTESHKIPLVKEGQGYWSGATSLIKPGDRYNIGFGSGQKAYPDPCSRSQPDGVHGMSEAIDLGSFKWTDGKWKNPSLKDYIIYELHVGTYTTEGHFMALVEKLDYIKKLGITAIELMPLAQFPGKNNWGYDGVFPFAVQNSYGGPKALQNFVDQCHKTGIAVILDVVYNHVGPEGNYLGDFAPYFTEKYKTPWGSAVNFDDAHCDGVRRFVIENALMWYRDFHIDALRMDAVHAIKDFSPHHILKELKIQVDAFAKEKNKKHYLIVESDLNDPKYIEGLKEKGYGMHAQWTDEFHHALRRAAGEKPMGYYADFNGVSHLAKAYRDAYVYDGQYSKERNKVFGASCKGMPGHRFIVFAQNHDQVGNRMMGERSGTLYSLEMQKLMAGAVFVSPFLPLLFMGEEFGEKQPFHYFVSHSDSDLIKAVREGRKREFKDFNQQDEAPDPFDAKIFNESVLNWERINQEPHSSLLDFYKTLISLRKQHPVLKRPERKKLSAEADEKANTLVLKRCYGLVELICIMNFSKKKNSIVFATNKGQWKILLDSSAQTWSGPGSLNKECWVEKECQLQPESILILEKNTIDSV
jgi:maltooligosyltrehalose trehalohydrolase